MNDTKKLEINGVQYAIGSLNTFDALHVARLIAPLAPVLFGDVFSRLGDLFAKSAQKEDASPEDLAREIGDLIMIAEPFIYRVSAMDRASFEDLVNTCLSCVERKSGSTFSHVIVNGNLMFADMDIVTVLKLTVNVIAREIRPIIAVLLKSQGSTAQ